MTTEFDVSRARFRLKKFARRAAVITGRMIRTIDPPDTRCVRVLTYHRFEGSRLDPCSIDLPTFNRHLDWLSDHCGVITSKTFADVLRGTRYVPKRAVMITIDDGHASVARYALPALASRAMRAIIFVCPGLIEAECAHRDNTERKFMDWKQLADAHDAGHEIAPHGFTHRSLGRMPISEALDEIERSKHLLERRLGIRTPFFSLPFGTRLDYSEALLDVLRHCGYRFCFTSKHGACDARSDMLRLPRLKIEGGAEGDLFPHIVRGCMDHWSFVDTFFYGFQQRGRL
jgi:peptidoglycan/xylan/chitin deacetylase (PgdA/CDA1 family)